ncbi:MAG: hypothetical protein QOI59_6656 [Gammaproteobacteria bacterium]|jgi:hypothetical protein|nr:hypothetical protein [Gammaproteobacteria bacterium]
MPVATLVVPARSLQSGPIRVLIAFSGNVDDAQLGGCTRALEIFAACLARDAFSLAAPAREGESEAPPLRYRSSTQAIEALINSTGFDIRCMQVLRNLLLRELESDERLSSMVVTALADADVAGRTAVLPFPEEDTEETQYPAARDALGFHCVEEELADSWVRRCMVEFVQPLQMQDLERISIATDPWFDLLEGGGYAFPLGHPRETESVRGAVLQFDEYSVEISMMRFQASDMAWNALVNMLGMTPYQGTIKSLTFD